jgi:hypothetical protein
MDKVQYKITNSTVKPVRIGSDGKDQRTLTDKVGHSVKIISERTKRETVLYQGKSTILDELDPGIMNMQRGGFIKIEPIKDISAALQEYKYQNDDSRSMRKKAAATSRDDNRKAKAVEMGQDVYAQKGGAEHEGAINPDGDPNFLAKAADVKKKKKRTRRGMTDAAVAGGHTEV